MAGEEANTALSAQEIQLIDDKITEINFLKMKISAMEKENNVRACKSSGIIDLTPEINRLNNELEILKQELIDLGVETSAEKILEHIGFNEETTATAASTYSTWHPVELVALFEDAYDMWSYTDLGANASQRQYHIVFSHKDSMDPYLTHRAKRTITDSFNAGSIGAQNWINNLITIYAEKIIGEGLSSVCHLLTWLPWELFLDSQPTPNIISSSGEALIASITTATVIKFVYVYDQENDTWTYALSTSKELYSYTFTSSIYVNGVPKHYSSDQNDLVVLGDFDNAEADAYEAFNNNTTVNTCLSELTLEYDGMDVISLDLYRPSTVSDMIYFTK